MLKAPRALSEGFHWTVRPALAGRLRPPEPPPSEAWRLDFDDPVVGPVWVDGRLSLADPSTLLVLIHGLGGCADSLYMVEGAKAAIDAGFSVLRLSMRGADRQGRDFYHAGLTEDLHAVLSHPRFASFERIAVLGVSLGGHLTLRLATEPLDPRVKACAAICAPLDLEAAQQDFDRGSGLIYRRYVLEALRKTYRAVAERREVPIPPEAIDRLRTIRGYDESVVVPRFGFDSPAEYYATQSAAGRLHRLRCPALLVAAERDPMVTARSVRQGLRHAHGDLRVVWSERGGHVGFPPDLDLDLPGESGLHSQVLGWVGERLAEG